MKAAPLAGTEMGPLATVTGGCETGPPPSKLRSGGPTRFGEENYGFVTPSNGYLDIPLLPIPLFFMPPDMPLFMPFPDMPLFMPFPDMFFFMELPDFIIRCFFRIRALASMGLVLMLAANCTLPSWRSPVLGLAASAIDELIAKIQIAVVKRNIGFFLQAYHIPRVNLFGERLFLTRPLF